ncbi:hypothetical protein C8R47DRAFT_1069246 [Mycena vitilis]|nr:hypothetical protein C8R47DRAFT_1069246 [Mycena vitilis]
MCCDKGKKKQLTGLYLRTATASKFVRSTRRACMNYAGLRQELLANPKQAVVLSSDIRCLRAQLVTTRSKVETYEYQVLTKHRQIEHVKIQIQKTSLQLRAQTLKLRLLEDVHGTLISQQNTTLDEVALDMGRTPTLEVESPSRSENRKLLAELGQLLNRNESLAAKALRSGQSSQRQREHALQNSKRHCEATCALLQKSYEDEKGRLRKLLEDALVATIGDLKDVGAQFLHERQMLTSKYRTEVNPAVKVPWQPEALQLRLIAVEGDILRQETELKIVKCELAAIHAEAALVLREREAREKSSLADVKVLEKQLETCLQMDDDQPKVSEMEWEMSDAGVSEQLRRKLAMAERLFREKYLQS